MRERPMKPPFGILTLLVPLWACKGDDDTAPLVCGDPAELVSDEDYFRIYFPGEERPGEDRPVLPSDFYMVQGDHGLQVQLPETTLPSGIGVAQGFPTFLPILLPFSQPLDGDSLQSSSFLLFQFGEVEDDQVSPVQPRFFELRLQHNEDEQLVYLLPEGALPEAAALAVAVTREPRSASGEALQASAHMRCLLDGWDDPDYALLGESAALALQALQGEGYQLEDLAFLNAFRTAAPHARIRNAAEVLEAQALQGGFVEVLQATDDSGALTDEVKALLPSDMSGGGSYPLLQTWVKGQVEIPDLRHALRGYGEDQAGDPETVDFTLWLPELQPGAEHPVLVFLHGISCCRELGYSLSATFHEAGFLIAAMDAREHYVRHSAGSDECYDSSFAIAYLDFSDPQGIAERFPLDGLDVYAMQRFLDQELDELLSQLAAKQGFSDPPRHGSFHYLGHSLGGMIGTNLASALPDENQTSRFVGSATGGAMVMFVMPGLDEGLLGEPAGEDQLQLFLEAETAWGLADPTFHMPQVRIDTLIQEAHEDETIPNACTDIVAFSGGLPVLEPLSWEIDYLRSAATPTQGNLEDGRTGGLFQFQPAHHNMLWSATDGDSELSWRVQEQALRFFEEGVIYDAYGLED